MYELCVELGVVPRIFFFLTFLKIKVYCECRKKVKSDFYLQLLWLCKLQCYCYILHTNEILNVNGKSQNAHFSFLTNVFLHMFYMVNILHKMCLPNDLAF